MKYLTIFTIIFFLYIIGISIEFVYTTQEATTQIRNVVYATNIGNAQILLAVLFFVGIFLNIKKRRE